MRKTIICALFFILNLLIIEKAYSNTTQKNEKLYLSSLPSNEIVKMAETRLDDRYCKNQLIINYLSSFAYGQYPIYNVPLYGFFAIDNSKDIIKNILRNGKIYKPHIIELIKKHAKEDSTVLDIGANIGAHTISLSKAVGKEGRVIAFEPDPKLFRELFINLAINNVDNIKLFWTKVSDKNDTVELPPLSQSNANISTDQITVDSLNLNNVSLIKIFSEEIPTQILDGMKQTLEKNKPILLIDIAQKDTAEKTIKDDIESIIEKLKKMNYDVQKLSHSDNPDYIAYPLKIKKEEPLNKKVLLAILARNKANVLQSYLNCIESLDYDKKQIGVYINTNNNKDNTKEILKEWIKKNENKYRFIYFENCEFQIDLPDAPHEWTTERIKLLADIKTKSLQKAKEYDCDYYFVIDCDTFIVPNTLKDLMEKDKPIIAPMLTSLPNQNDPYSNYFYAITDDGYCLSHPKYYEILNRSIKGTFNVPVVHRTYLIKSDYFDKLNYLDDTNHHEFIVFSRYARNNNVDQYICNEKNFGYILHFQDSSLISTEKYEQIASLNLPSKE